MRLTATEKEKHNLANLSERSNIASRESDPGLFVEDFCTWQENEYYRKIIFNTKLAEIPTIHELRATKVLESNFFKYLYL